MAVDLSSVSTEANAILDVSSDFPGIVQALDTLRQNRLVAAQLLIDYAMPNIAAGTDWTQWKNQMLSGTDPGSVESNYLRTKAYIEADDIGNAMEALGLLFKACYKHMAYLNSI